MRLSPPIWRPPGWEAIEAESGLTRQDLEQVAAAYAKIQRHHRDLRHGHYAAQ
ncbi:hypothetical protein M8494_10215 [Serratia ureilytica]